MRFLIPWLFFFAAVAACGGATSGEPPPPPPTPLPLLVVDEGCQPYLADVKRDLTAPQAMCILPYPSGYFEEGKPVPPIRTKSGRTITFQARESIGRQLTASASVVPMIVATLPGDIVGDGLPRADDDPSVSTSPDSPTFIRREDGSLVPHSVEVVDTGDPLHKAIVIRPRQLLLGARYVVGLKGVRLRNGQLAPPPEGFRRIRDTVLGKCADCPKSEASLGRAIDDRRGYVLSSRIPVDPEQANLQLAWWFAPSWPERSSDGSLSLWNDLLSLGLHDPQPRIDSVDDAKAPGARILHGRAVLRRIVESEEPVTRLGANGYSPNAYRDVPFSVVIPPSVLASAQPGRPILVAPKAFGSRTDIEGPEMVAAADRLHAVFLSIDWFGTGPDDLAFIRSKLEADLENFLGVRDAMLQAVVTWNDFFSLVSLALTKVPELQRDGQCFYDASFIGYLGTGHPLDGSFVSAEQYLHRAALSGSGVGLASMFSRWSAFAPLNDTIAGQFSEPLLAQAFLSILQGSFDSLEPAVTAQARSTYRPSGQRTQQVLIQLGVADSEVPNDTTLLLAQAAAATQTLPTTFRSTLLQPAPAEGRGSGLTAFDYGVRATPSESRPSPNDVHARLLTNDAALRQIDAFLKPDGRVIQPCDGACDPQ